MKLFSRFAVFLCLLLGSLSSFTYAADPAELPDGTDVKGSSDHPDIQRFKGSSIRFMEKKPFAELVMSLSSAATEPFKTETVEGVRTTLVYVMPGDLSTLEAIRAYQAELAKLGEVKVLFQGTNAGGREELDGFNTDFYTKTYGRDTVASRSMAWNEEYRYAALKVKRTDGDMFVTIYAGLNAEVSAANNQTIPFGRVGVRLDIVEPKARVERMVTVSSTEMSEEITKNGRVALYGILFDTGKADIKPESKSSLEEIAKLMKATPSLRLMVVGHTDTVGAFDVNRELSQLRAKSVVLALTTQYGVDGKRLQSFGASFAAPVATNATEAGRAKNRRVELVAF